MTTEIEEVRIDAETGLPELPEGMFWRVGEKVRAKDKYDRYDGMFYGMGVFLMKKTVTGKPTKVPVMGQRWWNKSIVVGEVDGPIEYTEKVEEVYFDKFTNIWVRTKEQVPAIATNLHAHKDGLDIEKDKVSYYTYDVPLSAEGIAHVASIMWKLYLSDQEATQKAEAKKRAEEEAKAKYFGDYPPKTLKGV